MGNLREDKKMAGEIGILNVGAGDTKLSFDPSKPDEVKRACSILTDMIARGYAILVEIGQDEKGPMYRRATAFDPKTAEYIIAGAPENLEVQNVKGPSTPAPRRRKGKAAETRIAAASTTAVAVARTSGG
jgi:hypothetical protein